MVYVTHDPAEALALGEKIAVLHQGALQQVDRPHTIYERPANRAVAELFTHEKDPIAIIKLKEVYDFLEATTDFCEDVADTLQTMCEVEVTAVDVSVEEVEA